MTVAHIYTVAFQGIEAREVDVQVHIGDAGGGQFNIVGLADKAVARKPRAGARRAVRHRAGAALSSASPSIWRRPICPRKASHYDLPIALGLLAAMGVLPASEMANYVALGELSLDAQVTPVAGVLPAALAASDSRARADLSGGLRRGSGLGGRARDHLATPSLIALVNHMKGTQVLTPPRPSSRRRQRTRARPARRERPGNRQARAGDRGGRRT